MVQNQQPTYVDLFFKKYVEAAREKGRQEAQEENERRMRELQEKLKRERDQALRDAQKSAKCDDEKQRRAREERERQIREEKEFLELRNTLMNYDFQEFPRIKKESFRDLYVGDVGLIRIALIGPAGSGKTSFAGKNNFVFQENLERNAVGNV